MARPSLEIIHLLRTTATQIEKSNNYEWGHMGACNCGFLAQNVTHLSKKEIHSRAMQGHGDWNEQLNDYCPTSGALFDDVISQLIDAGFDVNDLRALENLSASNVLSHLPGISLTRNNREHVVLYLRAWAFLLEESLIQSLDISFAKRREATESQLA
jgi:hypothetical protein